MSGNTHFYSIIEAIQSYLVTKSPYYSYKISSLYTGIIPPAPEPSNRTELRTTVGDILNTKYGM